jgi:hypothetical protein
LSDKARKANSEFTEKGIIQVIPVWIVSAEGIKRIMRSGDVLNEVNIVVDAITGIVLYTFSFR